MDGQAAYYGVVPEDDEPPMAPVKDLRDEFAMAAVVGLLAANATYGGKTNNHAAMARDCYSVADAMLAARAK